MLPWSRAGGCDFFTPEIANAELMTADLSTEEMLQHARALSRAAHAKDLRAFITKKIEDLATTTSPNTDSPDAC
jgi:hypothetical protein